jgi:hypothetical protein
MLFVTPAQVFQAENKVIAIIIGIIASLNVAFFVILFIGLHRRRSWGWKLNWAQLLLEVSIFSLLQLPDTTGVACNFCIATLCWFWPNAVYFQKRRFMFEPLPKTKNQAKAPVTTP